MHFSDAQFAQLIVALLSGIALFVLVYSLSERVIVGLLVLLIPFQVIDSSAGSLNMVITYLVATAFLIQGRLKKLPFVGPFAVILFAFLLSFTQSVPAARLIHILYLAGFFSNILLFYIVYNFLLRTGDWRLILNCFTALNVFVVVYCAIQFVYGRQSFMFFGIEELAILMIRPDGRLLGPFNASAVTAEYFSIQCVMLAYGLIFRPPPRIRLLFVGLIALNCLFLIATGNRGGFVTLIFGGFLFLIVFRRELGLARVAKMFVLGGTLFTAIALVVVNFSPYGMLFSRLEDTTVEGGIPDTRAGVWPVTWARIQEKPIIGHGPKYFVSTKEYEVPGVPFIMYAHSLPLHILYTTGIAGLLAWVIFFWLLIAKLMANRRAVSADSMLAGVPRLGLVIVAIFLISQIRIEFLRGALVDYQNYLFVLFAFLLACCDLVKIESFDARREKASKVFGRQPQQTNEIEFQGGPYQIAPPS